MAKPQKITPFLWFDKEARQAAKLYASAFKGSKIKKIQTFKGGPAGTTEIVSLKLLGQDLTLMSAGPHAKFSQALSFMVGCKKKSEVDALWKKLSPGGTVMMELGSYPFSDRYGWVQDKFGVSWQLIFHGPKGGKKKITPSFLFVGAQAGKAEEALKFYASIFKKSKVGKIQHYGKDAAPNAEGSVMYAPFKLAGQEFSAMDGGGPHDFSFNEAFSFVVTCKGQKEVDYYWSKLSADPNAGQCGWLTDKFGVTWQVVPSALNKLMRDKDKKKVARVMDAFVKMKKFDIKALKKAAKGK